MLDGLILFHPDGQLYKEQVYGTQHDTPQFVLELSLLTYPSGHFGEHKLLLHFFLKLLINFLKIIY